MKYEWFRQWASGIGANFNVSVKKYSETLLLLRSIRLILNNQSSERPTKERLHDAVDVIHEIKDMQANCDKEKQENEKIAIILDAMIDRFSQ
jgi:hypothetical protein